jgi:hypothetical protein
MPDFAPGKGISSILRYVSYSISRILTGVGSFFVGVIAVAAGLATVMLTQIEIEKYGYERNKTSFDLMWRLEERTQALKNGSACIRFILLVKTEQNWENWREAKPIVIEDVDDHNLQLFDRCVGVSAVDRKSEASISTSGLRKLTIREADVLELRSQINGILNAYDFALLPFKNAELGNRELICENLAGYFWSPAKGGDRKDTSTKKMVDHVFKQVEDPRYLFPNLSFFLDEVKLGKCPKSEPYFQRFLSSLYDLTFLGIRRVGQKLGLVPSD